MKIKLAWNRTGLWPWSLRGHAQVIPWSTFHHFIKMFLFHKNSKQWVLKQTKKRARVHQSNRFGFGTHFSTTWTWTDKMCSFGIFPLFLKIFQFLKFKVDFEAPKVIPSPITMMVNSWVDSISPPCGGVEW